MARLCKLSELKYKECGNSLLWYEHANGIYPADPYMNSRQLYCKLSQDTGYIMFGGAWRKAIDYNVNWRVWEGKPTINERAAEPWDTGDIV